MSLSLGSILGALFKLSELPLPQADLPYFVATWGKMHRGVLERQLPVFAWVPRWMLCWTEETILEGIECLQQI